MLYLLLCFSLAAAYPDKYFQNTQRYDGYQELLLVAADDHQPDLIHTLAADTELDFYVEARAPGMESSVLVPANKLAAVKSFLESNAIAYNVEIEDLQKIIDTEQQRLVARYERNGGNFAYDKYDFNTYDAVMGELENMRANCPDSFTCTLENLGDTYEGRPIMALTVSKGEGRLAYWFDSLIHAREWISLTTLMLIMDNIIYNYGVDADATRLLDNYDFVFVPIMNPDGYEYSWTDNPNWRKSRNINPGSGCVGTDLNRNYDFMWANAGSSSYPCSNTYHGLGPADQPETQHVQNKMLSVADNLVGLTSIHCQGRMWLIPYGFQENNQCAYPSDYEDMYAVAEATANAIQAEFNTVWTRGSICSTIYPAAGGTCDYAHGVGGIKYSSTPELRTRAVFADIIPSYQEVWQGVLAMVNKIEEIEGL